MGCCCKDEEAGSGSEGGAACAQGCIGSVRADHVQFASFGETADNPTVRGPSHTLNSRTIFGKSDQRSRDFVLEVHYQTPGVRSLLTQGHSKDPPRVT